MSVTQQDINRIKREMSAKYDINFDKELLPLICELLETKAHIHDQTEQMRKTVESATLLLHKKSVQPASPNISQNVYQSNWQAFWHGFGKIGLSATLAVLFGFIGYLFWFFRGENQQKALQIQAFLRDHKQISSFQDISDYQVVQDMKVGNQTIEYIELPVVSSFKDAQTGRSVAVEIIKTSNGSRTVVKVPLRVVSK